MMAPTRYDGNNINSATSTRSNPTTSSSSVTDKNKQENGFLTDDHFQIPLVIRSDTIETDYNLDARPFARGKYAQVRRCRHKSTGIEYAAKVIKRRRRTTDVRHEIMHEIRVLLMASDNERIVKLHEVFETPTEYILLLEMVEGGELQRVLDEEDSIPERKVIYLIKQLLEAISFLHDNNIAHLDIKPQNILLKQQNPEFNIKLCDFGISRFIAKGSELREIVGTPDYVAPEILHFEPISLATDMWSVGILTYVLLSGYSPFGGDTKQETFHNITNEKLVFPNEYFEGISEYAKDFITRLLEKKSAHRMTYKQCLEHEWLSRDMDVIIKTVPSIVENKQQNSNNISLNNNNTHNNDNLEENEIENKENISNNNYTNNNVIAAIKTFTTSITSSSSISPSSPSTISNISSVQVKRKSECEHKTTSISCSATTASVVAATSQTEILSVEASSVVINTTETSSAAATTTTVVAAAAATANKLFNTTTNCCQRKNSVDRCGPLNSPTLKNNLNFESFTTLKKHSLSFHEEKSEERVGIACQ